MNRSLSHGKVSLQAGVNAWLLAAIRLRITDLRQVGYVDVPLA